MAHGNTVFAQLLKLMDRHDFDALLKGPYRPRRKNHTLNRWGQFTIVMFAQLTCRVSLRDICDSLQRRWTQLIGQPDG
ncbi:MAG: hypothetical protein CSA33_09110 [Desulfobulbus propionicus]|nr:MAG: hypothetical protein CSA33_09110 [Desulfobulbus propionicus]